jgi:hypothetical protein
MSQNEQMFREDELVMMSHYNKQTGEQVTTPYPKISGRLRIVHEQNDQLSITTEIISYDGSVAVVFARTTTDKGCYNGLGMASLERDEKIAPAILELAESRAIARSLRFAGIGVESCSAEEVSHLNGNGYQPSVVAPDKVVASGDAKNGGNGNGRITSKQLGFIMKLINENGNTRKELNEQCITTYGSAVDFLTKADASALIKELNH